MWKQKILAVLALSVVVCVAIGFAPPSRNLAERQVTRQCFRSVHIGMSATDVAALLGPPGDYRTVETEYATPATVDNDPDSFGPSNQEPEQRQTWLNDNAYVTVNYDSGRVTDGQFLRLRPADRTALSRFLWWLKREWQRGSSR
jgi:hypothetical protein